MRVICFCLGLFLLGKFASAFDGQWIQLHDGKTQFGWQATSDADWSVADGEISVTSGEPGWLRTTAEFADFEIQLEYLAEPGTNSGVFVRMSELPTDPTADCYEINIADNNPFPTGSLVGRQKAAKSVSADREWHKLLIRADGARLVIAIDGADVCDYVDPKPIARGFIGLQFREGGVKFRDLKLRPINLKQLIGNDLAGWKVMPEMAGEFRVVRPGMMSVRGGPGQIETDSLFGDFVLQTECRTNAKHLNSGIFFRCIPGDRTMGYESQIDNTFTGDRDHPANCGTGGIFRRVDARRVVANDLEWFHKTIVAHKDHVSVWVNGYQVTDWTDTRPANENPRRGLRLQPGSIILQAHDPTTDVEFRNMGIASF